MCNVPDFDWFIYDQNRNTPVGPIGTRDSVINKMPLHVFCGYVFGIKLSATQQASALPSTPYSWNKYCSIRISCASPSCVYKVLVFPFCFFHGRTEGSRSCVFWQRLRCDKSLTSRNLLS